MWSGIRTAISGVNQPCQQSAYFALTALGSKLDCLVILGQLSGSSDCLLTICRRYSSSTTSNNSCGHRHQSLQRPSGSKDQQAFPLISPKGSHTATLRLASTTILKRGAMAHPYSGSASYIYANDVRRLTYSSSPAGSSSIIGSTAPIFAYRASSKTYLQKASSMCYEHGKLAMLDSTAQYSESIFYHCSPSSVPHVSR
jgi:hypothetical protein